MAVLATRGTQFSRAARFWRQQGFDHMFKLRLKLIFRLNVVQTYIKRSLNID